METFLAQSVTLGTVLLVCALILIILWLSAGAIVNKRLDEEKNSWIQDQMALERQKLAEEIRKETELQGRIWKSAYAGRIRQDAIARSRSVITGKVTENIVPFMPDFPFNPKDARFIGSPIDFIIFDGLDEGELKEIVILEVKTQNSRLSNRQKAIRDAITEGRFSWQEVRHSSNVEDLIVPEDLFDEID